VAGNIIIDGAKRQLRQFTMAVGAPMALANGIIEVKSIQTHRASRSGCQLIVNANHRIV